MPKPTGPRRRPQHLITTHLEDTHCTHCRAPIWEGHCGGEKTRIDPTPINQQAELGATLAGIPTYQIPHATTRRPTPRTQWNLPRWPADATIHAAHQCQRTWPASCRDTRANPHTPPTPDPLRDCGGLFDDPPPF